MADQQQADVSQRDADSQSQRDTSIDAGQASQRDVSQDTGETVSYTTYQKLLTEKKNIQARLKDYEAKEASTLSESEKLQRERDQLRAERDEAARELRNTRIEAQATKLGAVYADAIIALMPPDATSEKDIEKALAALQRERPRLFQTGSADGGAGGGNGTANTLDMNALIRQRMGQ